MNGTFTGVVDRIVDDDTAVILLEREGEVVDQFDVPVDELPPEARDGGGVLSITLDEGDIVAMEYEAAETRDRRASIREKLARLSRRLSDE